MSTLEDDIADAHETINSLANSSQRKDAQDWVDSKADRQTVLSELLVIATPLLARWTKNKGKMS